MLCGLGVLIGETLAEVRLSRLLLVVKACEALAHCFSFFLNGRHRLASVCDCLF